MALRRWSMFGLLGLSMLTLWLLFAGPGRLFGIETNHSAIYVLLAVAWVALFAIQRMPREGIETTVAPGEWRAWIGVAFMTSAIAYLLSKSDVLAAGPILANPDAGVIGRNFALLFVAWIAVSQVMQSRWKGHVHEDERDRDIERTASNWARFALTFGAIGLAVMLGFSPAARVAWATPPMVANLLVFNLLFASLVEHAVSAICYLLDRRA